MHLLKVLLLSVLLISTAFSNPTEKGDGLAATDSHLRTKRYGYGYGGWGGGYGGYGGYGYDGGYGYGGGYGWHHHRPWWRRWRPWGPPPMMYGGW